MSTLTLLGSALCFIAGISVLVAKPSRFTNQVFFLTAFLAALSLLCVAKAIAAGQQFWSDRTISPLPWLRMNGATSVLLTWAVWLLSASVTCHEGEAWVVLKRFSGWLVVALIGGLLCFSPIYIPFRSTPLGETVGIYYPIIHIVGYVSYAILVYCSWKQMQRLRGMRRVEMQFLSLNLALAFLLSLSLLSIGTALGAQWIRRSSVLVFMSSFGLSVWAMTFHRVFDARQIFVSLAQRIALLAVVVGVSFTSYILVRGALSSPQDFLMSVAAGSSFTFWLDRRSRTWLQLTGDRLASDLRNAVWCITRVEADHDRLITAFEQLLSDKCAATRVTLLLDDGKGQFKGRALALHTERPGYADLCGRSWATPEALEHERATQRSTDLQRFLSEQCLAAIVAAPRGCPTPSLFIAFGEKTNGWPFTYPEIERIQTMADLIDNILTHARLAADATLRSRIDHLAIMSRGLAHDLKNLITPVASFLVHAETRLVAGTAEAEVHAAAKRSVGIMNEYIREALFFANRLTPKFEPVPVRELLESAANVTATRAQRNGIRIVRECEYDGEANLDRVLIQRLLANLLNNAIDASPAGGMVTIRAMTGAGERIRIDVTDTGSGIAAEFRPRIFEPYFTTKQFGDDVRGFGLGLTICQKIVELHGGQISVDSELGRGTVVTTELPRNRPPKTAASERHVARTEQIAGGWFPGLPQVASCVASQRVDAIDQ